MAIYLPSPAVGAISGNAGGVCFVNARGSKVLRPAKTKGASNNLTNPVFRANFSTAQKSWRTLSVEQQKAWSTYANATPTSNRLGITNTLSGYQAFMKNRLFQFVPLTDTLKNPPLNTDQPLIAPVTVSWSMPSNFLFFVGTGPIAGDVRLHISAMPLQTDSLQAHWGRFIFISESVRAQNNIFGLFAQWSAIWKVPVVEGQIIAIRTRYSSTNNTWRGETVQIIKVQPAP